MNWLQVFPQMLLLVLLLGCGKVPVEKVLFSTDPPPKPPKIQKITYTEESVLKELAAPITSLDAKPDFGTGLCAEDKAEITFIGTFDAGQTSEWQIKGTEIFDVQTSGENFTLRACMAKGATSFALNTLSKDGVASLSGSFLSFSLNSAWKTIGKGHPLYPATGIQATTSPLPSSGMSSGSFEMSFVAMDHSGGKIVSSSGATGYELKTGLINAISEESP